MLARIASTLMLPGIALLVAACGSDPVEPLAATAGDRVDLSIDGPDEITRSGTYSWIAVTDGNGDRFDFRWQVFWNGSEDVAARADGRVLTLDVDVHRGPLEIRLLARADGDLLSVQQRVATCAGTVEEDRIIEECLIQH
jgi:hypothetical protein